jgi:hypothetical protein
MFAKNLARLLWNGINSHLERQGRSTLWLPLRLLMASTTQWWFRANTKIPEPTLTSRGTSSLLGAKNVTTAFL